MPTLNKMYDIPEHLYIHLQHLHKGNSSDFTRGGREYITVAHIVDENDKVTSAKAVCSPRDTPNRKLGRDIAVARAWKKYKNREMG